jgi:DNA-directed RNA polymerase subunit RPC12/RpoP
MTTRQGVCSACGTKITLDGIENGTDAIRFYWYKSIPCPICGQLVVQMEIVP